jgi:hypothetical protein
MTPDLELFLSTYAPDVQALAHRTRDLILEVMPNAVELVDPPSRIIAYGFGTRYIDLVCAISPNKTYVNLIFNQGAALPDPQHLLEGTGKRARHIKIAGVERLTDPGARQMIATAWDAMSRDPLTTHQESRKP